MFQTEKAHLLFFVGGSPYVQGAVSTRSGLPSTMNLCNHHPSNKMMTSMLITSMILLQAAVQFSGWPYTVIAFSKAAECSSFLRLVYDMIWQYDGGDGSFQMSTGGTKVTKWQGMMVVPVNVNPRTRLLCDCPAIIHMSDNAKTSL